MKTRGGRARIAVVGFAFRMPGGAGDGFWDALLAGRDLVSSVEPGRWAQAPYHHPRKQEPGTAYTFAAGSIGDVSGFDASFFGISPREAEQMDPQQRVLLEMTWEAFENAGIRPSAVRGSRCGVYIGLSSVDYAWRRADDLGSIDATTMTGNAGSIAANRISYVFDLRGPSMAVDTACSSSLVALHQACQSILSGESDAAFVGGINLHLHPYPFIGFSKASMLSRNGRCSVFDEHGDGYVRSEGGAVVLLKPLSQAIADGNRILAVVDGTGVNNDGRKTGLTVPSHVAQAQLLREVYQRAGIAPAEIDFVEAHGTGTAVGDPIEARALAEAIGELRPRERPLPIGSVKSNVGHLEAASGMAGLVKALYVLRHRRVPPNIHLSKPNRHIDFSNWNLAPVTAPLALGTDRELVVGVSAFGFGGTNAHAVLTSFEAVTPSAPAQRVSRSPLLLSARSPAALQAGARRMAEFLRERVDLSDYDIAYSAMLTREVHTHRLLADAEDRGSLVQSLERFADTGTAPGINTGTLRRDASAPAFLFCGNGSQWVGMGLQLLEEEPAFRQALEQIDSLYVPLSGRSILAELKAASGEDHFSRTEVAQPALFAVQVGLTRLLESRGVRPQAVCGHSVGEVAAAWASGALTLEAAVRVIYQRSEHQALTRGRGCMVAVELGEAEIGPLLATLALGDSVVIAAINSANSVTLAGSEAAMGRLETALTRRRIAFRRLPLEYAFHSPAMDPIRAGLIESLVGLTAKTSDIPLYSTVTGGRIGGTELGSDYWWRNVRQPVRFLEAIQAMLNAGSNTFLEIGPRPVLTSYLNAISKAAAVPASVLSTLTFSKAGAERIRWVIEQLELSGALHDSTRLFPVRGRVVELPHYAWQRERYWHPSTTESVGLLERHPVHPLLGYAVAGDELHWENHFDTSRLPNYADHAVAGAVVFPAAGFVEMALAAGALRWPGTQPVIEDMEILAPLVLDEDHSKLVRLRIDPEDGSFTIVSRDRAREDKWRRHVVGRLSECCVPTEPEPLHVPAREPDFSAAAHYALATSAGLQYGPAFQSVSSAWLGSGSVTGSLKLPDCIVENANSELLHPAYLDGAFQLLLDLVSSEHRVSRQAQTYLPVRIGRLELARPRAHVATAQVAIANARHSSRRSIVADFTLHDSSGMPVAIARNVRFRAAGLQRTKEAARWLTTRLVPMPRADSDHDLALPSPGEAASLCAQIMHAPERAGSRLRFAHEVEPLLDVLCAAFAERALQEIVGDESVPLDELIASGRVHSDSVSLLRRLLQILVEEGILEPDTQAAGTVPGMRKLQLSEPQDIWISLIRDYPEHAAIIAQVGAAGTQLAARLRAGPEGEPRERHVGESLYSWVDECTGEEADGVFGAVGALLEAAAVGQPARARLRVLYVAGAVPGEEVGSAAFPLLDSDRAATVVVASDGRVLEELRARHPAAAAVPGHVIDIDEGELQLTDSLGGRFDLIVLSEGLARSPDPAVRLKNIRRLMFDDGILLLIDQHASRASDLLFGLNPTWWERDRNGTAVQSRRHAPHAWGELLTKTGFVDVRTVHDAPQADAGPYLMIARAKRIAADLAAARAEPAQQLTWLLVQDEAGYSAELASALTAQLTHRGQKVIVVSNGSSGSTPGRFEIDTAAPQAWSGLIAELLSKGMKPDGWVHLAGLDLTSASAPPEARLAAQEARAGVLMAWLQACSRSALHPDCWVVAAQAGLTRLLPAAARENDAGGADQLRDAALWGLTRVAIQEFPDLRLRWVELADPTPCPRNASRLIREMLNPDAEDEILLTEDGRFVPRMGLQSQLSAGMASEAADLSAGCFQLDFSTPGPFRNLQWRATSAFVEEEPLAEGEVEIDVRAAGLNFRDVMYAMGLLPDEALEDGFCGPHLGMELAGVVRRSGPGVELGVGDEVIAIAPASFANRVRTQTYAVTRKPAGWSFSAAATVPTAFFTAYYALTELARVQAGERVLIHGAAGGVGCAAIQIAKYLGADVFATAGTPEKRDFVRLLGADRVFDSRSLAFGDEVLNATGGTGVDVVLNSLAGEAMRRNLRVLRPFGRMIELGKRDFYENSRVGLRPFRNNISYFGVDADQLIAHRPEVARRIFKEMMDLFEDGTLRPLPHRSFCAHDIEVAFRQMQGSRHIGKIVVTLPAQFDPVKPPEADFEPPALRADATYLVTGGLSGFGLQTARWLVRRGARHLALLSRRGADTPEAQDAIKELTDSGVIVRALACDVADQRALRAAFSTLDETMPPLRGIVHAAMVIEDALIRDMDRGQLHRVLSPKIAGAWYLHEATRERDLDFFLLYSSATTFFGNPGQGAYVAANMAIEALAAERRALGLAAACVSWGPIGDVGYLARHENVREALVGRLGGRALGSDEALSALESVLATKSAHVGLLELDWNVLGRCLPAGRAPKFSELARLDEKGTAGTQTPQDLRRWLAQLQPHELLPALVEIVRGELAQVLRIPSERIDTSASLFDLGMDSLMAVELSSSIDQRIGVQLSALSMGDAPTVERIAARLARNFRPAEEAAASGPADGDIVDQVRLVVGRHSDEMSEEDLATVGARVSDLTATSTTLS